MAERYYFVLFVLMIYGEKYKFETSLQLLKFTEGRLMDYILFFF